MARASTSPQGSNRLADPGGICVSGKVAREVEKKLAFGFEPMGAQQVKNIAEPVQAFHVRLDGAPAACEAPAEGIEAVASPPSIGLLALLIAGAGAWYVLKALQSPAPRSRASPRSPSCPSPT